MGGGPRTCNNTIQTPDKYPEREIELIGCAALEGGGVFKHVGSVVAKMEMCSKARFRHLAVSTCSDKCFESGFSMRKDMTTCYSIACQWYRAKLLCSTHTRECTLSMPYCSFGPDFRMGLFHGVFFTKSSNLVESVYIRAYGLGYSGLARYRPQSSPLSASSSSFWRLASISFQLSANSLMAPGPP